MATTPRCLLFAFASALSLRVVTTETSLERDEYGEHNGRRLAELYYMGASNIDCNSIAGYDFITSDSECETAAVSLSLADESCWGMSCNEDENDRPKGCNFEGGITGLRFNNHSSGSPHIDRQPICKM